MAISTNPIRKPNMFGQRLTRLADGSYLLRQDPGSMFGQDHFMPADQVRPELRALFDVGETDRIGTDAFNVWHPLPPTDTYKINRREAEVARLEDKAARARAELERDQALEREAVARAQREAARDPGAVALGELLGGLIVGAARRRRR